MGKVKKLKWWMWTLIAVAMVIVMAVAFAMVYIFEIMPKAETDYIQGVENPHGFRSLGLRPNIAGKIDYTIPDTNDTEATKQLAAELYQLAALNSKNIDNLAVYNNCQSVFYLGKMENYIDVDVVILKTQTEYFRMEYHLKNVIPLFDNFPDLEEALNSLIEMVTTERQYYKNGMEYALYQKVLNNKYDENGVPRADWNKDIKEEQREIPIFNRQQEGILELTQHYVDAQTIKEAVVEYNSEEGYYSVSMVLDENNSLTTAKSINAIRNGTGDKKANFNQIALQFEVWDNGYFKSLYISEKWSAKVIFSVGSHFNNHYYFSYSELDSDLKSYNDSKEMLKSIE